MRNVPQSDWPTFVTQPCIPHNHNVIHYILWWITCITKYSSPINWRFSVYFKFAKKNFINFINFIIFNWINWNWNFQFKFPCWNLKYQKVKKLDSFSSDWSMKSNFHQKPNIPTKSSIFFSNLLLRLNGSFIKPVYVLKLYWKYYCKSWKHYCNLH